MDGTQLVLLLNNFSFVNYSTIHLFGLNHYPHCKMLFQCKCVFSRIKISVSPDNEHETAVKPLLLTASKVCQLGPLALLQNVNSTFGEHHFSRVANYELTTL